MDLCIWQHWFSTGARSNHRLLRSSRERQFADFPKQFQEPSLPVFPGEPQTPPAGPDIFSEQQWIGRFDPRGKLEQDPAVF